MKKPLPSAKSQGGMMLLEVLVSILIFSIGLLGTVALYARSIQNSVATEDRARASLLANELAATMWTSGTLELASATLADWNGRIDAGSNPGTGLPAGVGTVAIVGDLATITITWRPTNTATGSNDTQSLMTQVTRP